MYLVVLRCVRRISTVPVVPFKIFGLRPELKGSVLVGSVFLIIMR